MKLYLAEQDYTVQVILYTHSLLKINGIYILRGFLYTWKKRPDMFSEGNAAHSIGCDSPLEMVMAVCHTFFEFEFAGSGMTARCG